MEISSNYTDILQDMLSYQVNDIKKAVIMEQLGMKVAMAAGVADDIITSLVDGGYQPDAVIPEDSTVSYHV